MLIKPASILHWINNFYGYGSWKAPFWFVALEESGGDMPEEVADKLDYFLATNPDAEGPTLCNIREVYKRVRIQWEGPKAKLFNNLYDYRFGEDAVGNKVWENLIRFTSGYRNIDLTDLLQYQKLTFSGPESSEALLKLYPLPGANHHGWNYNWLDLPEEFSFLKSRTLYQDHVYSTRIHGLLEALQRHKPELVLMYGMSNINLLKKSIAEHFEDADFTSVKAVRQMIPQHHYTKVNGTRILITTQIPTLRHNRPETGFDWKAFGASIQSACD